MRYLQKLIKRTIWRDHTNLLIDRQNALIEELRVLAAEELHENRSALEAAERRLALALLPRDAADERAAMLEIRAGTGGDEASLFAAEIMRMYVRYAELRRWKVDITDANYSSVNGIKDATLQIEGNKVYSRLKFESGVHRVQRVPATETQGRIHTSTVTVAIMPEAEEVDVQINEGDLRIDVFRASGAGGQHVNKTESAVRITHLPTGIVVTCQKERSQIQNKARAMQVLAARLQQMKEEEADAAAAEGRAAQIRTMDRSERIRTYNFPENRIADHRTGFKAYNLDQVMDGALEPIIESAIRADEEARLAAVGSEG